MKKYILTILLLIVSVVWAANTGEKSPASSAQEGSPATAWTNIDNVFASDDQRAIYTGTGKDTLYMTNFNMGIPADATIDSIYATTEGQGSSTNASRRRIKVHLTKDGTTIAGEVATHTHALNSDDTQRSTGATTPLWNTTWTAAEINATTFGIVLWKTATQSGDILIDHATLYVAYTEANGNGGTATVM